MISRVLVVSLVGLTLAGCVNNRTLSGDVVSASQAQQVQNVTYGTVLSVRPVQIQGGTDENIVGAIGGAVLGGFWVILWVAVLAVHWLPQQVLSQVV